MVEESNSSSAGKMEINDIGVKKEISFVAEVSCVKEKMSSEVSSEGNDSSKNTNEIVPRLKTEESEDCPNDCVPPFCFVGIKTEEPEGYESGESCASSGKVPSGGESPNNVERECSKGLNEKSGVELSNHPSCVDIKTESEEDVDTNSRPDSTSLVHRCDMGHSSNEFIRGIECPNFPILCVKQEKEEENVKEQSAGNTNNSAALSSTWKEEEEEPEQPQRMAVRGAEGKPSFSCVACEASFHHKNSLQSHVRSAHTGEKPFRCGLCGASFSEKSNHKRHLRTHTGERPFACDRCEACFAHKSSLQSHVRSAHTREKPFRCGLCAAAFGERSKQRRHVRTVHAGERPFACAVCRASFSLRSHLKRHEAAHAKGRV